MLLILLKEIAISWLIPTSVKVIKSYVNNTTSKDDDKILEVAKIGAKYLAKKTNNNVTLEISNSLNDSKITKVQKAKG